MKEQETKMVRKILKCDFGINIDHKFATFVMRYLTFLVRSHKSSIHMLCCLDVRVEQIAKYKEQFVQAVQEVG